LENADGTIDVYLANGVPLVQGKTRQLLAVELDVSSQQSNIYIATKPSKTLNEAITSSKLGALIEVQKTVIPKYANYLDTFSTSLATRVNELHTSGYDAYKNGGRDFFTIGDINNPSETIDINSIILVDPNRIAASETVNADGTLAAKISAVQNELLMNSGTATLNSYLAAVVGEIGSQVADATMNSDYQAVIKNQLENQRESVSGVSIDEEMIQLIKYQMGYTAAGKLVVTAEELLDTLIDLIR
jgi:flagellar hook-associated protein 1 FlgK